MPQNGQGMPVIMRKGHGKPTPVARIRVGQSVAAPATPTPVSANRSGAESALAPGIRSGYDTGLWYRRSSCCADLVELRLDVGGLSHVFGEDVNLLLNLDGLFFVGFR